MNARVLVTATAEPVLLEGLEELGFHVKYKPGVSNDALSEEIHQYEGIVISSQTVLDRDMLERAKDLRFIGRLGSGLEIIDVAFARSQGIEVMNSPEGNRHAVAEHALGMLLNLLNHLQRADREVRQGLWRREENRGQELRKKSLGIIGFGNTGKRFAQVLSGFDMDIMAYDKYLTNYTDDVPYVRKVKLEDIQREADIISMHVPLTPETHHLINMQFLRGCKDNIIIVNTSRGAVVCTQDLVEALESGKLGGACLDVFENEHPNKYTVSEKAMYARLFSRKNVVLSPHIAGWTHESKYLLSAVLLEKISTFVRHDKDS